MGANIFGVNRTRGPQIPQQTGFIPQGTDIKIRFGGELPAERPLPPSQTLQKPEIPRQINLTDYTERPPSANAMDRLFDPKITSRNGTVKIDEMKQDGSSVTMVCDENGKVLSYSDTSKNLFFRDEVSQVKNEHYEGAQYHTRLENNILRGRNLDTGKEFTLDMDAIFENANEYAKEDLKPILLHLPGEVLEDLSKETSSINDTKNKSSNGSLGTYSSITDDFGAGANEDTVIHELAHAVDNTNGKEGRTFQTYINPEFKETFKTELQAYETAGNKQATQTKATDGSIITTGNRSEYCTLTEQEMFAECYVLLMTGDCQSRETIEKHFPESLAQSKKLLTEIRELPDEQRHDPARVEQEKFHSLGQPKKIPDDIKPGKGFGHIKSDINYETLTQNGNKFQVVSGNAKDGTPRIYYGMNGKAITSYEYFTKKYSK